MILMSWYISFGRYSHISSKKPWSTDFPLLFHERYYLPNVHSSIIKSSSVSQLIRFKIMRLHYSFTKMIAFHTIIHLNWDAIYFISMCLCEFGSLCWIEKLVTLNMNRAATSSVHDARRSKLCPSNLAFVVTQCCDRTVLGAIVRWLNQSMAEKTDGKKNTNSIEIISSPYMYTLIFISHWLWC